jgi:hypothetical protein
MATFAITDGAAGQEEFSAGRLALSTGGGAALGGVATSRLGNMSVSEAFASLRGMVNDVAAARVVPDSGSLRFTQTTASPVFSQEGTFAGRRISEVAQDLRGGAMTADQVPVEFVVRDGNRLIVNTRSSLALRQAGIPESQWSLIDRTAVPEVQARISERLLRNQLDNAGASTLRITGSGPNVSNLR